MIFLWWVKYCLILVIYKCINLTEIILRKVGMKMKKSLKIGIIVFVIIIACGIIFGSIDKKRALDNKRPVFVVRTAIYKDGGSK